MELTISTSQGAQGTVEVPEATFGREFNPDLVHQVVVAYQAAARQGTKAQKNRSEVSGGGKKPWRQKGSGRARAGTIRSPIWRSGGVTFAAQPRSYQQKVNRKMYQAAMSCIISELVRQDRLVVVESVELNEPKTKELIKFLSQHNIINALIVTHEIRENLQLAARNLHQVDILDFRAINPLSLVAFEKVVITVDALAKIEDMLS